jgi:hypothetical protein
MSIQDVTKNAQKTLKDHAPSILAALAVGGVATTGLAAFKFGYNYGRDVQYRETEGEAPLTGKEKFEGYWKEAAPSLLVGALTITCVVGSTAISNRRNAALAGLVTLGEVSFREYRDKVEKVVTMQKREEVQKELAQDKLDKTDSKEIVFAGDGDSEFTMFDTLTSRSFKSNQVSIKSAEVEMSRSILNNDYISQNEWYDAIGLPRTGMGDDFGWNHDNPLEVNFIPLIKDGKPVMGLDYRFPPISTFDKL